MKQRITIEQINELTDEQKEHLRDWWKPEEFDVLTDCKIAFVPNDFMHPDEYSSYLPLLSIGQMIELLNDKDYAWSYENDLIIGKQNELCDALWNAVKKVL